uniref:Vitellogenin n=1 Tax=Ditylenchus dipsaci TaxID=166011 RepID=A0A915DC99_9BILA
MRRPSRTTKTAAAPAIKIKNNKVYTYAASQAETLSRSSGDFSYSTVSQSNSHYAVQYYENGTRVEQRWDSPPRTIMSAEVVKAKGRPEVIAMDDQLLTILNRKHVEPDEHQLLMPKKSVVRTVHVSPKNCKMAVSRIVKGALKSFFHEPNSSRESTCLELLVDYSRGKMPRVTVKVSKTQPATGAQPLSLDVEEQNFDTIILEAIQEQTQNIFGTQEDKAFADSNVYDPEARAPRMTPPVLYVFPTDSAIRKRVQEMRQVCSNQKPDNASWIRKLLFR